MSHTNVLLATLSMSAWSAKKHDKKISREVAADHGATEKVGRYNKNLMPFEAASYQLCHDLRSQARAFFNNETMPWLDQDGTRIVASTNFLNLSNAMRERRNAIENADRAFFDEAPRLFDFAKQHLNGMWRAEDYPSGKKLEKKFSFSLKFFPMPDATDFRVEELTEEVKQQAAADIQQGIESAIGDLWQRLDQVVAHMGSRLANKKTCECRACKGREFRTDTFNDTLVENVREVCEIIPRLNFTADPKLEEYRQQVVAGLAAFEPQQLRDSETLRETIAARAEQIQREMAIFMPGGAI
jgi:hypothetical protein